MGKKNKKYLQNNAGAIQWNNEYETMARLLRITRENEEKARKNSLMAKEHEADAAKEAYQKARDAAQRMPVILKQRFEPSGVDINKRHPETRYTFLMKALDEGDLDLATLLLDVPGVDVTTPIPQQNQSQFRHSEAKMLLELVGHTFKEVHSHFSDKIEQFKKESAIEVLIGLQRQCMEVITKLIEKGASLNARFGNGGNIFHLFCIAKLNDDFCEYLERSMVKATPKLLNQKAENGATPLGLFLDGKAADSGKNAEKRALIWRVLKLFAKHGVDISEKIDGELNFVSWLIANQHNSLLSAVLSKKEKWIGHERLLESMNENPLIIAAMYGNVAAVKCLLKAFPFDLLDQISEPPKCAGRDSTGAASSSKKLLSVQFNAASAETENLVNMLKKDTHLPPRPNISTKLTFTPLLAAIINAEGEHVSLYVEICQILLEEKLKKNKGIEDKFTPRLENILHAICYKKSLPVLKKVIEVAEKYSDSNKIFSALLLEENNYREFPLHYALRTSKNAPLFSLAFVETLLSFMQRVCSPDAYKMAIRKNSAVGTPLQQLVKEAHLSMEKIKIFERLWHEGAGKFDTEMGIQFDFSPLKEIIMNGNPDKTLLLTIFEFYRKDSDYQKLAIAEINIPELVYYEIKQGVRRVIFKNADKEKQLWDFFEKTDVAVLNCAAGAKIPSSHTYLRENNLLPKHNTLFAPSRTSKNDLSEVEAPLPPKNISFLSNRFSLSPMLQMATRLNKTPGCFYLLYPAHSSFRGADPAFYKIGCDGVYEVAKKGESGLKSLSGQTATISLHFQQEGKDIVNLDYFPAKKEYKIASMKSRVLATEIKSDCGQYTLYLGCIYLPEGAHSKEDKEKIQIGNFSMVIDLDDFIDSMRTAEAKIAGEKLRLESNNNNNLNVAMRK